MVESADDRKKRRASAEVRVLRPGDDAEESARRDAVYWLRVPIEDRAKLVWELSVEAYGLGAKR